MSGGEQSGSAKAEKDSSVRQFVANGVSMETNEVEAKLDEGNIQEAESALRDGLSLNFEVKYKAFLLSMECYIFLLHKMLLISRSFINVFDALKNLWIVCFEFQFTNPNYQTHLCFILFLPRILLAYEFC